MSDLRQTKTLLHLSVFLLSMILLAVPSVRADLIWDNNGSTVPNPQEGAGTWDSLGNSNWWNAKC